jgi:RHS repeat-associated protein
VYINNENTTSTDYVGDIAYTDGAFDYLITGEGRVTKASDTSHFVYEYHLKDHLGNTRVAFEATSANTLKVVQKADYYPFGLQFKSGASGSGNNKYLYNGKELQDDVLGCISLGWYDYGARFYDPQIGRWTTPDPLAEINRKWSPYAYCDDNPIRFIDPDGMTKKERKTALEMARSLFGTAYNSSAPNGGRFDCCGLVRYCMMQNNTIKDPFRTYVKGDNGVNCIIKASTKISLNDIREGDCLVIKSGGKDNGHIAFISKVNKDENDKVTSYSIIHAEAKWTNETTGQSGGGDVNEQEIKVGSEHGYAKARYDQRFYRWDNSEDDKATENNEDDSSTTEKSDNVSSTSKAPSPYTAEPDVTRMSNSEKDYEESKQIAKDFGSK